MASPARDRHDLLVLAIDVGGTKIAYGIVDHAGEVLSSDVMPAPTATMGRASEAAVESVIARGRAFARDYDIDAVGVAIPAVVDADGRVVWAADSVAGWSGVPVAERIAAAFGAPAVVEFDGYAATLGEVRYGAGRGLQDVAVVIVGTGVGAGFVSAGRLIRGSAGVAGAIGWLRFPTEHGLGVPLEEVAAGPAILAAARAGRAAGPAAYPDTRAVFDAAAAGDPVARAAVDRAVRALAAGVGAVVAMVAPALVVLGGSVGARPDVVAAVRSLVLATAQPHAARTLRIEPSRLGPLSSLYGAAHLALTINGERE